MSGPDRRTSLARPDLADARLEGLVRARRFAETRLRQCKVPSASLRRAPDDGAEQDDQLLFGEAFDVLEESDGWAWGQARRDGYVGYVRAAGLGPPGEPPTHWVKALRTYAFARPDLKSPALGLYSMNALLAAGRREGDFAEVEGAGWMFLEHLSPVGAFEAEPAAVAERFCDAPYLWGGRESLGLDCSGLIQQALYACGRACPRDADQQQAALTREVARSELRRGDLVFWPDHVAMLLDGERLVHATGRRLAVVIQPLDEVVARIEAAGRGAPAFRRL